MEIYPVSINLFSFSCIIITNNTVNNIAHVFSVTLEGHRWFSLLSHFYSDTGCYEGYITVSSHTKVLISHISQSIVYRGQERNLLACQWISRYETRNVRAILKLWLPIEFTWGALKQMS